MAYTTIDDPTIYFNTILYSGTGSENARTGVGFQPDWVWIKQRNGNSNHMLTDSVRGATKTLYAQNADAESTVAQALKSFDSDGFTVGTDIDVNNASGTYVAWNWLANGTASSNTDGSITSNVSANTTSGFSIVTWSGNSSSATIGHGLGAVPKIHIVKRRTNGTGNWLTYHAGLSANNYLYLNETDAQSSTGYENRIPNPPTSSFFSVGSDNDTNGSNDYVAYVFAEKKGFSKFGSYIGNGSTDGTFVYTGFKPAFIIIKQITDGSQRWEMYDNKRDGINDANRRLYPDGGDAEPSASDRIRFTANGFKAVTSGGTHVNGSGKTHIYMAFAENPFVTSTGVPTTAR